MISLEPIGIIHSPFTEVEGMPIQPAGAKGVQGTVEVYGRFVDGLCDLDGFSHIILLYHFHRSREWSLKVRPFMDPSERGLFATRAPNRPNPIGISVVRLDGIEGGTLSISDVDILDGTPLLDIKPYVPEFDNVDSCRTGWLEEARKGVRGTRSDERFR
ncbi:MAG: tRNA (N6-threonylcarbamoyladenosine(37)-N6)-methyltransferase TrmO [Candidatus Fermentibacteraceae bacterium]|nr:tRNA (N6-threonylcarbamoyladenosine(37)-N6)-methyltransferase TrmO [Candidatus Fermentibacteraceae bacterium]MBN2608949.1 tRNA (N6-threonylcarbamoyladenosine(37)-N6)-methyltransferase TrmO [Candidatus Fermentibacteraceae bacterium]